jgi:hypothetical protein
MNYYNLKSQLEAMRPNNKMLAYVHENNGLYYYDDNSTLAIDNTFVLSTGAGGNTRWILANRPVFPAWSVRLNAGQSITNGVDVKIEFNTELFDKTNDFDSTTNYRFDVNAPGLYYVTASLQLAGNAAGRRIITLIKVNGVTVANGKKFNDAGGLKGNISPVSKLIEVDQGNIIEVYGNQDNTTAKTVQAIVESTFFTGYRVG